MRVRTVSTQWSINRLKARSKQVSSVLIWVLFVSTSCLLWNWAIWEKGRPALKANCFTVRQENEHWTQTDCVRWVHPRAQSQRLRSNRVGFCLVRGNQKSGFAQFLWKVILLLTASNALVEPFWHARPGGAVRTIELCLWECFTRYSPNVALKKNRLRKNYCFCLFGFRHGEVLRRTHITRAFLFYLWRGYVDANVTVYSPEVFDFTWLFSVNLLSMHCFGTVHKSC